MHISPYNEYLVTNRIDGKTTSQALRGDKIYQAITADTLHIEVINTYEIYVCNDQVEEYCGKQCEPGTIDGWRIEYVASTDRLIKTYPFFDTIITKNDGQAEETHYL